MTKSTLDKPTFRAYAECARWLATCLDLGWSRDELDFLEALWWKYHDFNGRLVSATKTDARFTPSDEGTETGSATSHSTKRR
jgi:hypothetical protein